MTVLTRCFEQYLEILKQLVDDFCSEEDLKFIMFLPLNPRRAGGGGRFYAPPRRVFRRYLKNGGAQRRRFWHTLSYIFSA